MYISFVFSYVEGIAPSNPRMAVPRLLRVQYADNFSGTMNDSYLTFFLCLSFSSFFFSFSRLTPYVMDKNRNDKHFSKKKKIENKKEERGIKQRKRYNSK